MRTDAAAILTLLAVQALTPRAIAEHFHSSRQTVSKCIRILSECELVRPEQNGREIHYHINASKMSEIAEFLEPFRKQWNDRLNKLEAKKRLEARSSVGAVID